MGFSPVRAAERVARWHGKLRTQLLLVALAVICALGVAMWRGFRLPLMGAVLLVILVVVPLAFAIGDAVMLAIAKRDLASVGEGDALVVGRSGVTARDVTAPWASIRRLSTRPGGVLRSSLLVVETEQGATTLPLDFVDRPLAEIDHAVRQASSGRVAVEISPLEVVQRS